MTTTAAQRHKLATTMDLLVAKAAAVHYPPHDVRTEHVYSIGSLEALQRVLSTPTGLTMDCSQAIELLCHVVGLADPDGYRYKADGFTGTLLRTLPHYFDPGGANVGAIVIFGPGTGEHACMVRHPGRDPILFSHGWEGGPIFTPLSQERRFHSAPITFLAITHLG